MVYTIWHMDMGTLIWSCVSFLCYYGQYTWSSRMQIPIPRYFESVKTRRQYCTHTLGEGPDCTMLVRFRACWACFQLVSRILALSHAVWFVSVALSHTWLFLCFHMLHNMTLKSSCWTVSSCCIIENELSVNVLLISIPSVTVNHKPVCC
jgi:hypothetical protein